LLKGTIRDARVLPEMVSFGFSGHLAFSFFTAPEGYPERKRVDQEFDVRELSIEVPRFGKDEYADDDNPFRVNFKNAGKHATEAAESGEVVTVVLSNPSLSYDINGVIVCAACTHAQVMPVRIERQLRDPPLPH
jgi:hypothetical protein